MSSISEVVFERRCFGCDREGRVTFRRTGAAERTLFGTARSGTPDRSYTGTSPVGTFEELIKMLATMRFFDLHDEYRDPNLADGEWTSTTVVTSVGRKSVINRNGAAPVDLRQLEAHVDNLAARITWSQNP